MNRDKEIRTARGRLWLADHGTWAVNLTPVKFLNYTLPKEFKTFFQFKDPINEKFWSVEILCSVTEDKVKFLEIITRGFTAKRGLLITDGNFTYTSKDTESVARMQLEIVESNITLLNTYAIVYALLDYEFNEKKNNWLLGGRESVSMEEVEKIKVEISKAKRETLTPEKIKKIKELRRLEEKRAKETNTRMRTNEIVADYFGVATKTAEKWWRKISAEPGRKKGKEKKRAKNGKTSEKR